MVRVISCLSTKNAYEKNAYEPPCAKGCSYLSYLLQRTADCMLIMQILELLESRA